MKMEEDMEFLVAAEEDDDMVARILICLSRSETRLPWGHSRGPLKPRLTPPTEGVARPLLPPETRWGVRRTRTRSVATDGTKREEEEEEEALAAAVAVAGRRASPTTPLSWSGWSGSSGSVCRGARRATPGPPKRRREPSSHEHEESRRAAPLPDVELRCGGERIRPPVSRLLLESHGDSPVRVSASAAVAFFSGSAPQEQAANGVAVGRTETSRTAAQVEPLGQRWTGSGSASVGFRRSVGFGRPGKKKTVVELHALEESLSMEQENLQKELEKHKGIYQALLEENMRLKKVESRVAPHMAKKQTATYVASEAAANPNREWPQHVESTSESQTVDELTMVSVTGEERCEQLQCTSSPVSVPGRMLLFDLNCWPDEHV